MTIAMDSTRVMVVRGTEDTFRKMGLLKMAAFQNITEVDHSIIAAYRTVVTASFED